MLRHQSGPHLTPSIEVGARPIYNVVAGQVVVVAGLVAVDATGTVAGGAMA